MTDYKMASLILFNKPFRVLSQFSDTEGRSTLADFMDAPNFRVAGRLDYDSEGLLLLTDDGHLQQRIANPRHKLWKTYLVQVEGVPGQPELEQLQSGVQLKDGITLASKARSCPNPDLWERDPPIRQRKSVADSWIELSIREGRNRQVRRMTAALGYPTLRLIRSKIGSWCVDGLAPGEWRRETVRVTAGQRTTANLKRKK
jgi:23S rRNA pseudouridine2457 synthase